MITYPFYTDRFITYWDYWKRYRKEEHKFRYKSEVSEQSALMRLAKLAQNDEMKAIQIINMSIASGWKGFYKLKDDGKKTDRLSKEQREYLSSRNDL